jgi:hypothetical protein
MHRSSTSLITLATYHARALVGTRFNPVKSAPFFTKTPLRLHPPSTLAQASEASRDQDHAPITQDPSIVAE